MAKIRLSSQALAGSATAPIIAASSIVASHIAGGAAIEYAKLNLGSSIKDSDVVGTAAIAYSKLNLVGAILGTDISATASIPYSKLTLTTAIVNGDVSASASIVESKILFNTSTGHDHNGTNSKTVAAAGGYDITRETPAGTINGTNTSFTLATSPVATSEIVFLNGVLLDAVATAADASQYAISGTGITLGAAPTSGDSLKACYNV